MNSLNSTNGLAKQNLYNILSTINASPAHISALAHESTSFISSVSKTITVTVAAKVEAKSKTEPETKIETQTNTDTNINYRTNPKNPTVAGANDTSSNSPNPHSQLPAAHFNSLDFFASQEVPNIPYFIPVTSNPALAVPKKDLQSPSASNLPGFKSFSGFQKFRGILYPHFSLQKREFSTNIKYSGWGSHTGFSSAKNDRYPKNSATSNRNLFPASNSSKNSQEHNASVSPSVPGSNASKNLSALKASARQALDSGQQDSIKAKVLSRIEAFEGEIDTQVIELYLEGLLLVNTSSEDSAVKLAFLLRKYPLLASSLKMSQLMSSSIFSNPNRFTNNSNQYKQGYNSGPYDIPQDTSSETAAASLASRLASLSKSSKAKKSILEAGTIAGYENTHKDGRDSENPIHVIVTEEKKSMFYKTFRWLVGTLIYAFCILTFLNLFLENSGVMKASTAPKAFTPEEKTKVTFSDVQGCEEAKSELQELVDFLKDPKEFTQLGGKLPQGVLLTGPPGTGKTLLARAVAGEAGVPFFFMSGAEFDEIYVGVGSKRLRELFAAAREKSPSIVFIDEIDAIGSKRNQRDQSYMKQTLNQLLVELDGFSQSEGVIFIAATNFPESLDPALTRPGRFDRVVDVPLPDVRGRISILKLHTQKIPLSPDLDLSIVARGTVGFSGAELSNLVNIAAIKASKERAPFVTNKHLEFAKDRILMGAERTSAVITEDSRKSTAYHEGGHALVAMYTPGALPLHKATIMPRGHALGVTVQLPELDRNSYTRQEYYAMLDVCMGGYAAENLIFGYDNVTSGSSSDLSKATSLATSMVTQYGMSDKIGHVAYSQSSMEHLSSETRSKIDDEIRSISEASYTRVVKLLTEKRAELDALANALIEYETLDQKEIIQAIKNVPIERPSDSLVK